MPITPTNMLRAGFAAVVLFAMGGCQTKPPSDGVTRTEPPTRDNWQHPTADPIDRLIVEVTLLRIDLSTRSIPTDSCDLWAFMAEPVNATAAIDAALVGEDTPRPETGLHMIEVADAPRLIRALDEVCDTCLVASPRFTMLRQRDLEFDCLVGIPAPPYFGPRLPPHPLDGFGLRFEVDRWDQNSTTFNLSVAHYPQSRPEGQEVHAAEGPDYSGGYAVLREAAATFEDGKTYIVGGFADWRYVGPVVAWDFEEETTTTAMQEEELIAIIKVIRVVDDTLVPLNP